ncbi:MAG: NnrU family protein [Alphaproteobacteria bacterium]|jgi:uncharacterized membrane protein|nr:NnrU family protein [Alphaproteobacteria bacterium]
MASLVLAAILFLAIHALISGTRARDAIIARIGEKPYLGLFSLASLGAVVWMSIAYAGAPYIELWSATIGARHTALVLMLPALYLVIAGGATPNPTATGAAGLLERERAARGILKVTRHPMMWGFAIWALAHLLANGDLAGLIFFGSFSLMALFGPHLIDAKMARNKGASWRRFADETSWLPFQAMLQGRTRLGLGDIAWWQLVLTLVLYLAILLWLHEWVIGVPPIAL